MPELNGEQTAHEIRGIKPDYSVIFSSGISEKDVRGCFVCEGIAGFIRKPQRSAILINTVKKVTAIKRH